ncbi:YggS family pyridoxal phosphate-dependent enzyme [Candidatus Woesearchaeota archaeon]|nr:YggS family pyridoxal phosphate-dependent enzyme [Candidatus Woesearchaeota archaeon]
MGLKENITSLNERISGACQKVGRESSTVTLLAATKTISATTVNEALALGIHHIGENTVQEAHDKFPHLEQGQHHIPVVKHMIGHLQTNKVKLAVQLFDVIQSVDSLKLAKEINKRAQNAGKLMPVFIEVNVAGEENKGGIPRDDVPGFYDHLLRLQNLRVDGLMTLAPYVPQEETRPYFMEMSKLATILKIPHLSMGMTSDFEIAIEEGSTMVRIGEGIFGKRKKDTNTT